MSPENEYLLLHDVVSRLRSAIPVAVAHVGSEDDAELLQDGTVMAAEILTNAHRNGKRLIAGKVACGTKSPRVRMTACSRRRSLRSFAFPARFQ
jgi:hypothetical protein